MIKYIITIVPQTILFIKYLFFILKKIDNKNVPRYITIKMIFGIATSVITLTEYPNSFRVL
jgi:hypothetical protein